MLQVVLYLAPQNGVSTAAALSSEAAEQLFLFSSAKEPEGKFSRLSHSSFSPHFGQHRTLAHF